MKQIKIKQLALRNFKGAINLNIDFTQTTNIEGDNGTGKTTVFDAFNWLLWGKNSANETSFEIKTLNPDNTPIHNLEHEVSGIIDFDGAIYDLKRVYREKWVKTRGNEETTFSGHSTDLFINDVPTSNNEFKNFVSSIIPDNIARIITDPQYFNTQLKWEQRRLILNEVAGGVDDAFVLSLNPELDSIQPILNEGKTLQQKKDEIRPKKTKIKAEIEAIPSRVDEVQRAIPEAKNWSELEQKKQSLLEEKTRLEGIVQSKQQQQNEAFAVVRKANEDLHNLKIELSSEERNNSLNANSERTKSIDKKAELANELKRLQSEIEANENETKVHKDLINIVQGANALLLEDYNEINDKEIKISVDNYCPTCKQHLPDGEIEVTKNDLFERANNQKVAKLNEIAQKGTENKNKIAGYETKIQGLKEAYIGLANQRESKQNLFDLLIIPELTEIVKSEKQIELEKQIESFVIAPIQEVNTDGLKQDLKIVNDEIQQINVDLLDKGKIEISNNRIAELQNQALTMSQELAQLERIEMQILKFEKAKMELIEQTVNSKFDLVKFKMFEPQVNGGETPTCICMVNGVPYSDLNTASKVNASLDIIRTLQNHYQINAPVFIDNRESITSIIDMNCQIINLIKVEGLSKLQIN